MLATCAQIQERMQAVLTQMLAIDPDHDRFGHLETRLRQLNFLFTATARRERPKK